MRLLDAHENLNSLRYLLHEEILKWEDRFAGMSDADHDPNDATEYENLCILRDSILAGMEGLSLQMKSVERRKLDPEWIKSLLDFDVPPKSKLEENNPFRMENPLKP